MSKRRHGSRHAAGAMRPGEPRTTATVPDRPVLALALIGLAISGYLSLVALSGTQALFCAVDSACEVVQGSRFSLFLGVPVAIWGVALYALVALVAWRSPPRLRRWRRLWALALLGTTVSVYLTLAGLIALDAVCGWCLASLATILGILAVLIVRRPASAPGMPWSSWLLSSGIAALTVVAVLHLFHSGLLQGHEDPELLALARHLEESGAKFYGAFWCPSCREQKRLFGASSERLPYVECSPGGRTGPLAMACVEQDIQGYPTWIVRGQRYQQVLTPEELALHSGFRRRVRSELEP